MLDIYIAGDIIVERREDRFATSYESLMKEFISQWESAVKIYRSKCYRRGFF